MLLNNNKRYLVLLDKNRIHDGIQAICQRIQIQENISIANTANAPKGELEPEQIRQSDIVILDRLGVALVSHSLERQQGNALRAASHESNIPIIAVTEEEIWYAFGTNSGQFQSEENIQISSQYLQGYRDGVNQLIDKLMLREQTEAITASIDESSATWGLQVTKVLASSFTGKGIRVAVLDTGMDLDHPDFVGRKIVSSSFVLDVPTAQDGNGHGTHCIGTACGPRNPQFLPRYGIAYESEIYVGKVLADKNEGSSFAIVAGINWAINNDCAVISMSLGGRVSPSQGFHAFYEELGKRALEEGSLIIAAAGNDSARPGLIAPVGSPANCPSFMAVASLDSQMQVAKSSNGSINPNGGEINIAAPGVNIYSSAPDPAAPPQPPRFRQWSPRYDTISGTSMATPHVAGIAALYAQATGKRGKELGELLISKASPLSLPSRDVGAGLVQAPF